jgi:hypothetical protein
MKMMFMAKIKALTGIAAAVFLTGGLLVSGVVSVSGDNTPKPGTGMTGMGKPPVHEKKEDKEKPAVPRQAEQNGIGMTAANPAESQASVLGLKIRLEKNPWNTAEYREKVRTLRQVHVAMVMFATNHQGRLPSKMKDLSPDYLDWNAWTQLSKKDSKGMSVDDLKAKAVFKIHDNVKGRLLEDIKPGQIMALEIPRPGMQWITVSAHGEAPLLMEEDERKEKGPDFHEIRMYPSFEKADFLLHMDNAGNEKLEFDLQEKALSDVFWDVRTKNGQKVELIPRKADISIMGFSELPRASILPGGRYTRKLDLWSMFKKPEDLSGCTVQASATFVETSRKSKTGKIIGTSYSIEHRGLASMTITQFGDKDAPKPRVIKEELKSNKLTL